MSEPQTMVVNVCPSCGGEGAYVYASEFIRHDTKCERCNGTGAIEEPCAQITIDDLEELAAEESEAEAWAAREGLHPQEAAEWLTYARQRSLTERLLRKGER